MLQCHLKLPLLVAHQSQIVKSYSGSRHLLYGLFETICRCRELALLSEGYPEVEKGLRRSRIER